MTNKQFTKCEYYCRNDNVWSLGYCMNPIRQPKRGVALIHCQGSDCKLETKERWW